MADVPVLELRSITKRFPGVVANDGIDFDLLPGEVHALLGENGAGKSTLMNIVYGLYKPDEGEILIRGKPVTLGSAREAIMHGIGMVHQHFMLIPVMTVAENIVLASEPTHGGVLLEIIRGLQAQGKSLIFISHKLKEVVEIADRITVLRRGRKVETISREGATETGLARMMVGREVLLRVEKKPAAPGQPLLEVH